MYRDYLEIITVAAPQNTINPQDEGLDIKKT